MDNISVFIDISGSVNGFTNYWLVVENWLIKNKKEIKNIYLWNTNIKKSSFSELIIFIKNKYGEYGTDSYNIAKILIKQQINNNIVIFTDGEVSQCIVSKTDNLLENYDIDNVECYIISNNQPNLSVSCPFTRNNTSKVYYKKSTDLNLQCQIKTKKDYEILNYIDTINLSTFIEKYQILESIIVAKNMGKKGDLSTKELLIKLKKNLSHELSNISTINYGVIIRKYLEENNFDEALNIANDMTKKYFYSNIGMEIDKKINYLISLCGNLENQYSIDLIKSNKIIYAQNAKELKSCDLIDDVKSLTINPIECPIMMDMDVAQIMILDNNEPILANLEKNIVDDIISCPLRILNYSDVLNKLKKSISNWSGIKANIAITTNPFTKQKLLGTIPLGCCNQHIEYGNYIIYKLFSNSKILGNPNLYYAVIWYLIKNDTFEFLNEIKTQVLEHLIFRFKNSIDYASLCGLPQFVLTKIPTDIAIWYCVNSCLLNQPTDRDTLRFHLYNLDIMIDILNEFKYPIHIKAFKQINRTKVLLSLLSISKKDSHFKNKIECLYQNAIEIFNSSISWIPIDGQASLLQISKILNSFPSYYKLLSVDEIIGLGNMVDASKSASDIKLDIDWNPEKYEGKINWFYGLKEEYKNETKLSLITFRPYYKLNNILWFEKAKKDFELSDITEIFSGYRKFTDYIIKYNKIPNESEYLLYCYLKYKNSNKEKSTLPYLIKKFYKDINDSYKPIYDNYSISTIIENLKKYSSITNRITDEYNLTNIEN